jgi:hypothetical protein
MHDLFIFDNSSVFSDLPLWWRKFMDAHSRVGLLTEDELNAILKPLNARFFTTKTADGQYVDRYLRFNNEADMSFFILRWS